MSDDQPGPPLGVPEDSQAGPPEPGAPGTTPGAEPDEAALRVAEALVFASTAPVPARVLAQILPTALDVDAVIAALRARYAGRGVELVDTGGGVQFRTAADVAPLLRKVIEVPRRLPRAAMETLAIIAYHQPVSRPEIEQLRGTSLSQQTLDALLEANLVEPKGRRESPGRPTLWGTTSHFLAQFGLKDIRDLPRREDLLVEPPRPENNNGAPAAGRTAEDDLAADGAVDADGSADTPAADPTLPGVSSGGAPVGKAVADAAVADTKVADRPVAVGPMGGSAANGGAVAGGAAADEPLSGNAPLDAGPVSPDSGSC